MYICLALCNFVYQIYIAATNLSKFEKEKMRTVGNGGIEMVAMVKIFKNAQTLYCGV